MEKKLQAFRKLLYAILENEFLGPSFQYFCTLSEVAQLSTITFMLTPPY